MKKALGVKEEEPAPSQPLGGRRANAAPSGPDAAKLSAPESNSDDDRAAREAKEQEERAAKAARMKKALGGSEEPPSQPLRGRRANAAPSGLDTIKPFSLDDSDDDPLAAARGAQAQAQREANATRMKPAFSTDERR